MSKPTVASLSLLVAEQRAMIEALTLRIENQAVHAAKLEAAYRKHVAAHSAPADDHASRRAAAIKRSAQAKANQARAVAQRQTERALANAADLTSPI